MVRPQIPLRRPLARTLDRLVAAYQRWISPLTAPACRFHPSCSAYARDALASQPLWRALALTSWRLLRCQPLCKGGYDPVPPGPYSLPCDPDDAGAHHPGHGPTACRSDSDRRAIVDVSLSLTPVDEARS